MLREILTLIIICSILIGYYSSFTNGIAIFGALLSLFTFYLHWNSSRHNVEVLLKLHKGKGFFELTAINKGTNIYLDNVGIEFPETDVESFIFKMNSDFIEKNKKFLEKGNDVKSLVDGGDIADHLRRFGLKGEIKIKGFYDDKIGGRWRSSEFLFNIDEYKPSDFRSAGM